MPHRPEIFISATTMDLSTCRRLVSDAMLKLGCVPVVQEHFAPDARTVREMLRERIAGCDAIIHLAGECFGHESRDCAAGEARRSYTQMEYDAARELRKPVYTFLCVEGFPYDAHTPEPDELHALQQQHRAALAADDHLFVRVRDRPELEKSVRELQTRFEHISHDLRKTRSWLARGVAVALAALLTIGALLYTLKHRADQSETHQTLAERRAAQAERELVAVRAQLQQETTKTDLVNEKLDRVLVATGLAEGDPAATAREQTARELGISVEELQRQLADERTDVKALLVRIDQQSDQALAQADQWKRLKCAALVKLGNAEYAAGRYAATIEPCQTVLTLVDVQRDPLVWCDAAQALTAALWQMGRYDEAEPIARQLVERRIALQGTDHPETLSSINNLATLLQSEGDLSAEFLYRQCLQKQERSLGKEHPSTLICLNNLATLLQVKGDYADAESLYLRCLEARERTLGDEHPDTLSSVHNLATLLQAAGDLKDAESLYRRCLDARENVLGSEHLDTLSSVNDLATLLQAEGELDAAEPLFRRILQTREHRLGNEHPMTISSINNLATLLYVKRDYAAAEPLYWHCLRVRERILGNEHPDTLGSVNNIANLLDAEGDLAAADSFYRRALSTRERTLGKDHLSTAASAFDFSFCRQEQGDFNDALALVKEAVDAARSHLPANNPTRLKYEQRLAEIKAQMIAIKKPKRRS